MKEKNKVFVIVIFCLHGILLFSGAVRNSPTYDEVPHLTSGYSHLKLGDYRLNPEHPPLVFLWCSLPLLFQKSNLPPLDRKSWEISDAWSMGWSFFYKSGNNPKHLIINGRIMMMILSLVLGFFVYLIAARLFGNKAGLLSLLLYAFSPTILAHGNLVTTDLALSLFLLVSVYALWKVFHRFSIRNILISTIALVGLFNTKFSAVLIIPMALWMILLKFVKRSSLYVGKKQREIRSLRLQILYLSCLFLFQILVVLLSIWMFYGFHFSPFQAGTVENARYYTISSLEEGQSPWDYLLRNQGLTARCFKHLRNHRILPDAFLYGFLFTLEASKERSAFFNGEIRLKGWWYYFPYCFLVKTPLPLFGILSIALYFFLRSGKTPSSEDVKKQDDLDGMKEIYDTAPFMILFVVYWAAALKTNLNIGHRHLLPIYPVLLIISGAAIRKWHHIKPLIRWLIRVLVFLFLLSSLRIWPHYLSYFNLFAGGPRNGYRRLVDSNLDWGQDLPALKKYLDENPPGYSFPFTYLAYFGMGNHLDYDIKARLLPCVPSRAQEPYFPLQGGRYCISATLFQQLYLLPSAQWTESMERAYQEGLLLLDEFLDESRKNGIPKRLIEETGPGFWKDFFDYFNKLRFGRLCAALRQKKPDAYAGYSILIFNLTDDEIKKALFDLPAKVIPDPDFMKGNSIQRMYSPSARFHYCKGLILAQKGNYNEAIKEFKKSLDFEPDAKDVKEALGKLLQEKNK